MWLTLLNMKMSIFESSNHWCEQDSWYEARKSDGQWKCPDYLHAENGKALHWPPDFRASYAQTRWNETLKFLSRLHIQMSRSRKCHGKFTEIFWTNIAEANFLFVGFWFYQDDNLKSKSFHTCESNQSSLVAFSQLLFLFFRFSFKNDNPSSLSLSSICSMITSLQKWKNDLTHLAPKWNRIYCARNSKWQIFRK